MANKIRNVGLWIAGALLLGAGTQALADCPSPCTAGYTCYYVDASHGSDSNAGTSPAAPWQHVYKVRAQTFTGSIAICLMRASTWFGGKLAFQGTRAVLAAGAVTPDGSSGAPQIVDAYGSGDPPTLNAEYSIPGAASWSCASHICTINTGTFPEGAPTRIDMVKFGQVWGTCKGGNVAIYCPTTGGTAALAADYQFNYNPGTGVLAVYDDIGTAPVTDYSVVAPVLDGQTQILDLDGVNYMAVQHLRLLNQSWYALEWRGNSGTDHLTACNIYTDTEVPFNLHGSGFFLHPGSNASDITLCNDESHRGFYGYDFECQSLPCTSANSIASATLVNVKAYFNRSYGLNDTTLTGAAAHYSYAHFYGNQIKWPSVGDTNGGVAGTRVLSSYLDPAVKSWKVYTPRVALNFGDVGRQNGADSAFNGYVSALGASPVSIGVATNFPVVPSLVSEIQGWVNAGYDINLLGLSDASYQSANTLTVQYTGSGSAAAMTIGGSPITLSTSVTGASGDNVSYDLTNASYNTIQKVEFALRATGKYTAILPQPCSACSWISAAAMLAQDFAAVSGQDIRTAPYTLALNPASFLNDELSGAKTWLAANLTGTSGQNIYWYPGLLFCNSAPCAPLPSGTPEAYTVSNGYALARGSLSMQAGSDGIQGGYDLVASRGVDAHGMVTCAMSGWASLDPKILAQTIQVLAEKSAVWGVPYLCYFQPGTFTNNQLTKVVADLNASGITLMTNSGIASFLAGKRNLPAGSTSWVWAPDGASGSYNGVETYLSPTVGAGSVLGGTYQLDVFGRLQAQFRAGWDIGASVLVPTYLGKHPGH